MITTREMILSFRQGGAGNCVSIAVIKAGIQIFGVNELVLFEQQSDGVLSFIMKDGFEGTLTEHELNQAKNGSKFILQNNEEIYNYANLCFASMSKRAFMEHNENADTFQKAIATLNNGEYYFMGADWLGLRHHKRAIGLKYVWSNAGVVGASAKHCFFCSEGLVDDHGTIDPIRFFDRLKYTFYNYYRISKEPIY